MLSQEKVKQQLQGLIKQIGLKDEVKKHLRIKLAQRLQKSNELPQFKIVSDHLRHRIISSLIKEHLDKIGCTYSSSVFAAQSQCDQKMLQRVQLVQLLNISSIHHDLSLIEYIIEKSPGRATIMRHQDIQTQEPQGHLSLEKKFTIIDLQFRRVLQESKNISKQVKIHDCQQEKAWYQKELAKFRQFEAHKIKTKVGEEWRIKFQAYANDMENDLRKRIERIRNKEKALTQEFISRQKMFQQRMKGWESSAKSRLELIQLKENALNRQKTNLQLERNNLIQEGKKTVNQTKEKQRQYENLLLNVQKRIDYQVGIVKLSIEQAQNEKQQQFVNRRKFVDQEYGKLMGIKDSLQLLKTQNERLSKQNTILRDQNKKLRQQLRVAYGQNSTKGDRIDVLRDQLTDAKNAVKDLEIKLADEQKLRKKRENEVSEARKQLQQIRGRLLDESSQSEIEVNPKKEMKQLQIKMLKLRQQRKKDIQRFKLEI